MTERLIEVAIKRDGNTHHGARSHWELRHRLGDKNPGQPQEGDESGFWTNYEQFVTRSQAVEIGVKAGQLSDRWLDAGRELLSSDVNWDASLRDPKSPVPPIQKLSRAEARRLLKAARKKEKRHA